MNESLSNEVIIIDPKVRDYKNLIIGLNPDIPVILLPEAGDGLALLANALTGYDNLSAIHLVSHGSDASLLLGSNPVNSSDLLSHQNELATIASHLVPGADVLLYGCSVAGSVDGQNFIDTLATALNADVAASTDNTGAIALGGDWDLEYASGEIDSILPFTVAGQTAASVLGVIGNHTSTTVQYVYHSGYYDANGGWHDAWTEDQVSTHNFNNAPAAAYNKYEYFTNDAVHTLTESEFGFTDPDGDNLAAISISSLPGSGSLVLNGAALNVGDTVSAADIRAGALTYYPVWSWSDYNTSFSFQVQDDSWFNPAWSSASYSISFNIAPTVTTLAVDTSISTTIDYVGNQDTFRIDLEGGRNYQFALNGADSFSNPYLYLYNSSGTLITEDDNSGAGNNALISFSPTNSDSYYLVAAENGNNGTKTFTLQASKLNTAPIAYDQLDYFAADSVHIFTASDFGFSDPDGNALAAVSINSLPSFGALTLNGTAVNVSDIISVSDIQAGALTYYSDAPINSNYSAGNFSFAVRDDSALGQAWSGSYNFAFNVSSDVGSAIGILDALSNNVYYSVDGLGSAINDTLDSTGNRDSFKIDVQAGHRYSFAANGSDTSEGTLLNPVLYLYDASNNLIAANDDTGNSNALISFTAPSSTTYYLVVGESGDNQTGTYTLKAIDVTPNHAATGAVVINDTTPTQKQILTVTNTLADLDGFDSSYINYQWKAGGVAISGATGSSFSVTQAQVGKTISVTASYTDLRGTLESKTSAATAAVLNVNDAPTGSVVISGVAKQGQVLTASHTLADVDGLGSITYTWKTGTTVLATGDTYKLPQAAVGKTVSVTASYTDQQGTHETRTSMATAAVANVNDLPTGTVSISGIAKQGQVLTAANTLADADGLGAITYTWKTGTTVLGTGNTYTLTQAAVGKTVMVTASYKDQQGTAESKTSLATATVANSNDAPTGTVTITGIAKQGQILTAAHSLKDVDGLGAITYTWKTGTTLLGTGNTYTLTQAAVDKTVTVTASYKDLQGTAESKTSVATATVINVNDAPTGTVTITGIAKQGQILTAAHSLKDADGLGAVTYTWKTGTTVLATGNTYTLSQTAVEKVVTVTASYKDLQGTAESKTSLATAAVINVNDAPTGTVSITGVAKQGQTLTAANTLADLDGLGTISYQWKANGTAINGATANIFKLSLAEAGKKISVTASYTDALGTAESKTSAATSPVISAAPGVTFTRLTTNANTSEGNFLIDGTPGQAVKYAVVLNKALAAADSKVVIDFVSSDITEGTVTPRLTFTASNWNTPQTITIQGQDDMQGGSVNAATGLQPPEGAIAYTIKPTINQNLTTELNYVTVFLPTYTLQNNDDIEDIPINGGPDSPKSNLGTDGVDYMTGSNLNDQLYGKYGFDQLKGGYGDDKLYGEGGNDVLYGQQGNDVLYGGYQNDKLYGNDGNDKLYGEQDDDQLDGGKGNDWLDGGIGADTMSGGVGNDTYVVDDSGDVINDNGSSTDIDNVWIQITAGAYTLGASLENAVIKTDADVGINGNAQNNILTGGGGDNKLNGGWGKDSLSGNTGNDILSGDAGIDTLNGGAGNDVLIGGAGNDILSGGVGKDIFKFNAALTANVDKIKDFSAVDDTIQLENAIFTKLTASGTLNAAYFFKGTAAHDLNDYVIYNPTTGTLSYDADGSGAGAGVQVATLGVNLTITTADFVVI